MIKMKQGLLPFHCKRDAQETSTAGTSTVKHPHKSSQDSSKPTTEESRTKPWKYSGYNVFTRLIASDGDFLVVRRFGHLHARLLLWLQDSVSQLEEELDSIDAAARKVGGQDFNNGSFREEPIPRRTEILKELKVALDDYGTAKALQ